METKKDFPDVYHISNHSSQTFYVSSCIDTHQSAQTQCTGRIRDTKKMSTGVLLNSGKRVCIESYKGFYIYHTDPPIHPLFIRGQIYHNKEELFEPTNTFIQSYGVRLSNLKYIGEIGADLQKEFLVTFSEFKM